MTYSPHSRQGFTLIEILIAIALVLVMGALVGPKMLSLLTGGKKKATISQLKAIKNILDTYNIDIGQYPESLQDLVKKPADEEMASKWNGPYLDKKPVDGWGVPVIYKLTAEGENPYELYSYGAKGKKAPKEEWIDVWKV